MAIRFRPLPLEVFTEAQRPYIAHMNTVLRELTALEGVIRHPRSEKKRSDATVARATGLQVDVSRITPSVSQVVSGQSTVVGTPALVLSTVNTKGTTATAVSVNSSVAIFGTQTPRNDATSAAVGSSAFAARADHVHQFPTTLQSAANASTVVLTDDATNQTLTGSLGNIAVVAKSGVSITALGDKIYLNLAPSATLGLLQITPDGTTASPTAVNVQLQPTAGSRTGIAPTWFGANASDVYSGIGFRCWDVQYTSWVTGQITGCTIIGYDTTAFSIAPSSGSSGGNSLYFIRSPFFQINNANATWSETVTGYFKGVRRNLSAVPIVVTQAALVVEPPTAGTTMQVGVYIRQQSAQATGITRVGILIDAQNSGTNRYSIYGISDRAQFTGPLTVDGAFGLTGAASMGNTLTLSGYLAHTGPKAGLLGATPTAVYGVTGVTTGFAVGTSTGITVDSTHTGNTGSLAYTFGDVIFALKQKGLLTT